MNPQIGRPQAPERRTRSVGSFLATALALVTYPPVRQFLQIWRQPALFFGLLMALFVGQLGTPGGQILVGVIAIMAVTLGFLAVGVAQGGTRRILSAWRACPAETWLYVLVCVLETVLALYRGGVPALLFAAGRWGFLVVLLTTCAICKHEDSVRRVLEGTTYGAGVIGLLTLIHGLGIVRMPFGLALMPPRTFGSFRMPFARTIGIAMSPDKFALMASLALGALVGSFASSKPMVRPGWMRVPLLLLVLVGCVITQTRAVYIGIAFALCLASFFWVIRRVPRPRFATALGAWAVVAMFSLVLVVSNLLFLQLAPESIVDVGTARSVENVAVRSETNEIAWRIFQEAPWLGIGHGRFEDLTFDTVGVHNHFLEQLVATGLIGGIPYLLFHLFILVRALRAAGDSELSRAAVARVLATGVLVTYLEYQFFPGFFVSPFAIMCGLIFCLERDKPRRRTIDSALSTLQSAKMSAS
jgi:O-antigen ligase